MNREGRQAAAKHVPQESTIVTPRSRRTLFAFCGDDTEPRYAHARGNPCTVSLLPSPPAREGRGAYGKHTQCATWESAPREAQVRCWNHAGHPIQCCGHGLLSCAALWLQHWESDGCLQMGNTQIKCRAFGGRIWVGFAPLATGHCEVPDWLPGLLGAAPMDCAEAGGADGYLVVRLGEETLIDAVNAPGDALNRHSQRALIVTRHCRDTGSAEPAHIQLRYFAPQYGEPEDTATGSAMRVLADYWQKQGLGPRLAAQQHSAAGGVLFSHIDEDVIWIGGNVVEHTQAQDSA